MPVAPGRRSWLRWSVRTLLVLVTLCCVVLAVVVAQLQCLEPQWAAIARIETIAANHASPDNMPFSYDAESATVLGLPVDGVNPRWRHVRTLRAQGFETVSATLNELPQLPHVQRLELIHKTTSDYELRALAALPDLQELDIWCDDVSGKFAGEGRLPATLRTLAVRSVSFDDEGVRELGKCTELTRLRFIDEHPDYRAGFTDWSFLQKLTQLRELEIQGELPDDAAVAIANMPQLEHLVLQSSKLTDRGMRGIARNQNIRVLQLNCPSLEQETVLALEQMSGLQELTIGWMPIDLSPLQISRPNVKIVVPTFTGPASP